MAWNPSNDSSDNWSEDNDKTDQMNQVQEVVQKLQRKDNLKREIQALWKNPLSYIVETEVYAFEIILTNLTMIYIELDSEMSDTQKEDTVRLRKVLENSIDYKPPFKNVVNQVERKNKIHFNKENWAKFRELLLQYHKLIFNIDDKDTITKKQTMKPKEV